MESQTEVADDPVIKVIDVNIHRFDDLKLYLLQYPLRPIYRNYGDQGQLSEIFFRTEQKTLRFKYELDTENVNYDPNFHLSQFPSQHIINSKLSPSTYCDYALGIYENNTLTLIPNLQIVQFRPEFHVQQPEYPSSSTNETGPNSEEFANVATSNLEKSIKNPIGQDGSNVRHRIAPSKIFENAEKEEWKLIQHIFDPDTFESHQMLQFLLQKEVKSQLSEASKMALPMLYFWPDRELYVNQLCGIKDKPSDGVTGLRQAASGPLSFSSLSQMSVEDQVLQILKHTHIETFSQIKAYLARSADDDQLITILRKHATVVMGNWVIKSHLVYSDYEALCRQFLIILLMRQEGKSGMPKEPFRSATNLSLEKVSKMIQDIGRQQFGTWHLKLPRDEAFCAAYPSVISEYENMWKEEMPKVAQEIRVHRDRMLQGVESKINSADIQKACKQILSEFALPLDKIRFKIVEKNPQLSSASSEDIQHALSMVATEVGSLWALKHSEVASIEAYRAAFISFIHKRTSPFIKQEAIDSISAQLQKKITLPDHSIRKILREFSENKNGLWHLREA